MVSDTALRQRRYRERCAADDLVQVRAYVPKALAARVRRIAEKEGCPQSHIIARAYALGLEKFEDPSPKKPNKKSRQARRERRRQRHKKAQREKSSRKS